MIKMDIIDVLEENFVEYASPIICNNLPSLDGLLPVHRKVIWGMYERGITHEKPVMKMLRCSGHILPYYTFGDMPLAGAMKNMGNNSINYFYLFPKGNFGDKQRKNSKGASARYIECKLSEYSSEMVKGIDKNCVPMKRNYDNTKDEPIIMPSPLPNILINTSQSIAVGEASKIPSHNLKEVCNCFIDYITYEDIDSAIRHLNGADYRIGGQIVYEPKLFERIYKTGKGSFNIVGKYRYNPEDNSIIIYEIPYETYIDNIESDIIEKVESGIFKEVLDTHNSTDKDGIGLIVYLKKNTNVDEFILKLRRYTSFEKPSPCNFTILDLDGKTPLLMTLEDIIVRWRTHRRNCIKSELSYDINKNDVQLNKLYGLRELNKDLDKAIELIRSSKTEKIAMEKIADAFGLNKEQCEYITTIKLVNINEDWIFERIKNIDRLENENKTRRELASNDKSIDEVIIFQLNQGIEKFGEPRRTTILKEDKIESKQVIQELLIDDYNCQIQLSKQGYFKKTKLTGLNSVNRLKDGDEVKTTIQCKNSDELLVFCEDLSCYKFRLYEMEETKLSSLGQYIYNETKSKPLGISVISDEYKELLVIYNNFNFAKISLDSFKTKQNRKVLSKSLQNADVCDIITLKNEIDVKVNVSDGRSKVVDVEGLTLNKARNSGGSKQVTWKKVTLDSIEILNKTIDNE